MSAFAAFTFYVAVYRVQVRPEGIFVRSFTGRAIPWTELSGIDLNERDFALELQVKNGRPLRILVLLEGLSAIPEGIVRYVPAEVRSTWPERSRRMLEAPPPPQ